MHTRVLVGVAAWLAGAGTATGGSLLAVSLLGQGFAAAPSQQLSVAEVNQALRNETSEKSPSAALPAASPLASPSASGHPAAPSPRPARHRKPPPRPQATGTVLTSQGGTVVARCQAPGTYLQTWSPQQDYEVAYVFRGPAASAQVTFTSMRKIVTMTVACSQGVPSATTRVRSTHGGDD